MNQSRPTNNLKPALFIGIDWADQKHDCHVIDASGQQTSMLLEQSPEAIDLWCREMALKAGGGTIAIMLEQSKGALIHALMFRENIILFPVNPKQLAKYRESFSAANGKNDPTDAMYLARMLRERIGILRPWKIEEESIRLLNCLSEQRRAAVDRQTKLRQQLVAVLKQYFPLLLTLWGKTHQQEILLAMLSRWSDPRSFRRADRRLIHRVLKECGVTNPKQQKEISDQVRSAKLLSSDAALIEPLSLTAEVLGQQLKAGERVIEKFDQRISEVFKKQPDAKLFSSLRGAGPALAPRLLCAFGTDRNRWETADDLASFTGIAPITRQSGKQRNVTRRYACPKYLRQTFHEFADHARTWCPWTRARYRLLRDRGMKHHAALRKLARSWIRILYRVWKTRTPFDCGRYIENLRKRSPEIIPYLENPEFSTKPLA
jgi:hypothetical protein